MRLKLLAVASFLMGLLMVLGIMMLGSIVVPIPWWIRVPLVPIAGLILVSRGALQLWRPTPRLAFRLRRTRLSCGLALLLAGITVPWAFGMKQAQEASAARGGGLLGGLWVYPLGVGVLLCLLAVATWFLARGLEAEQPEAG